MIYIKKYPIPPKESYKKHYQIGIFGKTVTIMWGDTRGYRRFYILITP